MKGESVRERIPLSRAVPYGTLAVGVLHMLAVGLPSALAGAGCGGNSR